MTAIAIENTWTEQNASDLTVALVAVDGHRMRLRGAERLAAIRLMVDRGLDADQIADRLRTNRTTLQAIASRAGISLRSTHAHWTHEYTGRAKPRKRVPA